MWNKGRRVERQRGGENKLHRDKSEQEGLHGQLPKLLVRVNNHETRLSHNLSPRYIQLRDKAAQRKVAKRNREQRSQIESNQMKPSHTISNMGAAEAMSEIFEAASESQSQTFGIDEVSDSQIAEANVTRAEDSTVTHVEDDDKRAEIAAKESTYVRYSKGVVILVLACATAIVGYFTYFLTHREEEEDFDTEFENYAAEIIDLSVIQARDIFDTLATLTVSITSFAMASEQEWPFVVIPDFFYRTEKMLQLSPSFAVGFQPIVPPDQRARWELFSQQKAGWLSDPFPKSLAYLEENRPTFALPYIWDGRATTDTGIPLPSPPTEFGYYTPVWQGSPPSPVSNYDTMSIGETYREQLDKMVVEDISIMGDASIVNNAEAILADSVILDPIHKTLEEGSEIVGFLTAIVPWSLYFDNVLPEGTPPLDVVVRESCGRAYTFRVEGPKATYLDNQDLHDRKYSSKHHTGDFNAVSALQTSQKCKFSIDVYPTREFEDSFYTNRPITYTIGAVVIFIATSLVFIMYDCIVQMRQKKVLTSARKTDAIVSSLFPEGVRDRLMEEANEENHAAAASKNPFGIRSHLAHKPNPLGTDSFHRPNSKPIADLFPNVTVLFADIVGFTAWSSVREPTQVFTLLEHIYGSFDAIAKRRGIFKVETIGDCYVAASGLPKPRKDHAKAMVLFARDCLEEMNLAVHKLEVVLGPETAELAMRIGLHSGPVTAGVLRGEKSRFQLFGDTVNTASRIETSGMSNRIHISTDTANELIQAGKGIWVKPRKEMMTLKGKGEVQTYFVDISQIDGSMLGSSKYEGSSDGDANINTRNSNASGSSNKIPSLSQHAGEQEGCLESRSRHTESRKQQRLIDWNAEVLQGLLKQVVAVRKPDATGTTTALPVEESHDAKREQTSTLDEFTEIIKLPDAAAVFQCDPANIELSPNVVRQLQDYVAQIARMYKPNPFHSFEHASHVVQSVNKLMARVVTPSDSIDYTELAYKPAQNTSANMHKFTYGITSDPLILFACAFSALIHDVDHSGLPNAVLAEEDHPLAQMYRNKSIAEQNSVDLAWKLLQLPKYNDFRRCIYQTQDELRRFRQLVVNAVMATDIMDKDLNMLRKKRWDRAFKSSTGDEADTKEDSDRKATIVIEHLIQASDVAHTMQHWHVYLKWNERLFHEMYRGYKERRNKADPSVGWYEGELSFFDHYLIPLAKKLSTCGVFGVASDEYLTYATANRQEWERKGRDIVAGYLKKVNAKTSAIPLASTGGGGGGGEDSVGSTDMNSSGADSLSPEL